MQIVTYMCKCTYFVDWQVSKQPRKKLFETDGRLTCLLLDKLFGRVSSLDMMTG